MFCPRCGRRMGDDAVFCENCGTSIKADAPEKVSQVSPRVVIEGNDVAMLLKRGYQRLEDEEWEIAFQYFDHILDLDIECAEAYLGKELAEQCCENFDSLVYKQLTQTSRVEWQTCYACQVEQERVEKAVERYTVDGYLSRQTIRGLFEYNLTYQSAVACRKGQYQRVREYYSQNKAFKRALEFAQEDLRLKIEQGQQRVFSEMERRISIAEQEEYEAREEVKTAYGNHLKQAEERVQSLNKQALQQRETDYQEACVSMASAQTVEEYQEVAARFEHLLGYKDSAERSETCCQNAVTQAVGLQFEHIDQEKTKKWPLVLLGAAAVTTLLVIIIASLRGQTIFESEESVYPVTVSQSSVPTPSPTPVPTPKPLYDINGEQVPDGAPNYNSTEWIAVDAYNLYSEWEDNPVRAELRYNGHWVRICYPYVTSISEKEIYVDDTLVYGCTITFHIDDIEEATKTNKSEYPVISGYFVVDDGSKDFHVYHSQVLESVDYSTWVQKRYPNGLFGALGDVTIGWNGGETPASVNHTTVAPESGGTQSEYLFPSDSQYITDWDLDQFDRDEIVLIRNEIYARHGCNFNDATIRAYFTSQSWYSPVEGINASNFDSTILNEYERTNIDAILSYERKMGWRS